MTTQKKQIRIKKKTKKGGLKKKQNRDQKKTKDRRGRKAKEKRVESFSWRGVGGEGAAPPPHGVRSWDGEKKRKETEDCTDVSDE